ncbi:MAG: hypothetical protein KGJ09_02200 [Candidatus Omnitrophica bacterium]|nr:hypothetical protein [Candidatus Omnitrophota bacterium]MDE2008870.1 hypothetical protein [Candidatus Omnitrophota bacterium]MDE2213567.1 hypothetical protein [Candidatus Omnitrophota bacterium]MDE2230532.1 hypothetical protein [Candidatus Omnitrophota bacterium]
MVLRIILFGLLMVFSCGEARAQLFLEEGKKVFAVSGGEHLSGYLLIHNTSADPAHLKVYWEDFKYVPPYDGSKKFLPEGTAPDSAGPWVTFSPQEFDIPSFGRQKVDYIIHVPTVIKEGHYGVLFFERSGTKLGGNEAGLTIVTRVGCLFFIEPKNKNKDASIQNISIKDSNLTANFTNQGNVILIPHTTYYILQNDGTVLLRGDANKLYVPPGASAQMVIPLKQLKEGNYTLVINADLQEGDVVVKQVGLVVDPSGQITATPQ